LCFKKIELKFNEEKQENKNCFSDTCYVYIKKSVEKDLSRINIVNIKMDRTANVIDFNIRIINNLNPYSNKDDMSLFIHYIEMYKESETISKELFDIVFCEMAVSIKKNL